MTITKVWSNSKGLESLSFPNELFFQGQNVLLWHFILLKDTFNLLTTQPIHLLKFLSTSFTGSALISRN